jgi:hypothetical protein
MTYLLVSLMVAGLACCQEIRTVKVAATEEDGKPIEGVDVTITFMGQSGPQTQRITGKTDVSGVFQASGRPELRMYVRLEKDGYYTTDSDRLSRTQDHNLTYVLRKIQRPIPLYAKKFRSKLPKLGVEVGFDFEVGDWVAPYGGGRFSDILVTASVKHVGTDSPSGSVKISFPNPEDGVFTVDEVTGYRPRSQLIMPHLAPETVYVPDVSREESGYQNESKPKNVSYFLRTRSREVTPGKFAHNYAKFQDGFKFVMGGGVFLEEPYRTKHPEEYGLVEFTYYYNPTSNDRNLEFDTKQNLFKNLDPTEQVHEP